MVAAFSFIRQSHEWILVELAPIGCSGGEWREDNFQEHQFNQKHPHKHQSNQDHIHKQFNKH